MHPTVPLRIKPERGGKIIINKLTTPTIKPRLARFILCRIACVFTRMLLWKRYQAEDDALRNAWNLLASSFIARIFVVGKLAEEAYSLGGYAEQEKSGKGSEITIF